MPEEVSNTAALPLIDRIASGQEQAKSFALATRHLLFRRDGRAAPLCFLYRAADRGVRGIRLESARVGGRRVTTDGAIERFVRCLNEPRLDRPPFKSQQDHMPRMPAASGRKAHSTAVFELQAAGLL